MHTVNLQVDESSGLLRLRALPPGVRGFDTDFLRGIQGSHQPPIAPADAILDPQGSSPRQQARA